MPWLQIKLQTSSEQVEQLSDLLTGLGAVAVTLQDAADQPLYEPELDTTPLWQQTIVSGLFTAKADVHTLISQLKKQFKFTENQTITHEILPDQEWERSWMDGFQPMQFGQRLWVCPSWLAIPDPNAVNLILDPGLAFGTGTHATTALCLQWLDSQSLQDKIVIDYGCGSGILAIAALKLGASKAWAIDLDPQALEATIANAQRNQINSDQLVTAFPKQITALQADILIANILAKPLIELASHFMTLLKPAGQIVLSGILENQITDVITAYSDAFHLEPPVIVDGWARLTGQRI